MKNLELRSCNPEERIPDQCDSAPIVLYDHEPRPSLSSEQAMRPVDRTKLLNRDTENLPTKPDNEKFPRSLFIGNKEPPVVAKAAICVIAFIVMVICLCFLFVRH